MAQSPSKTASAPLYDLLLHGGHVLDDKNHIDSTMDVAIKDGKIVYDLNRISADPWNSPPSPNAALASRWTTFAPAASKKATEATH